MQIRVFVYLPFSSLVLKFDDFLIFELLFVPALDDKWADERWKVATNMNLCHSTQKSHSIWIAYKLQHIQDNLA